MKKAVNMEYFYKEKMRTLIENPQDLGDGNMNEQNINDNTGKLGKITSKKYNYISQPTENLMNERKTLLK